MSWKKLVPAAARRSARSALRRWQNPTQQYIERGYRALCDWNPDLSNSPVRPNSLRQFFERRSEGPGIWKWLHYFEIYDQSFREFRNQEINVMEIGVYSGGSLDMWRDYFGPKAHIYGVDIEPSCKAYERDNVSILIGDQSDRSFWRHVRASTPKFDIVIDDGSHIPEHQIVTLEEMLPHLRPGGIFLCEDIHGPSNDFHSYAFGLVRKLSEMRNTAGTESDMERRIVCDPTNFQEGVYSISFHPYVTTIKLAKTPTELRAPKHGTEWQPFLT